MTRLLVLKPGDAIPAVRDGVGDYDALFARVFEGVASLDVVQVHRGAALPDPEAYDGVIITGSPTSVLDDPWIEVLAAWTRATLEAQVPLLGVCYGHQLLAQATGGRVAKNPLGYEIGTAPIEFTPEAAADPLLGPTAALGTTRFQAAHGDAVVALPPGATRLAHNARAEVQAFSLGPWAWGVQFHPEFDRRVSELYVEGRAERVRDDARWRGQDPEAALAATRGAVDDTPEGPALLLRFEALARGRRR